jgi:hypothetical protein
MFRASGFGFREVAEVLYRRRAPGTVSAMTLVPANFPDLVWGRLKAWAKVQSAAAAFTSLDECLAFVKHAAEAISGRPDMLRREVVEFYAAETLEMIAKYRAQLQDTDNEAAV